MALQTHSPTYQSMRYLGCRSGRGKETETFDDDAELRRSKRHSGRLGEQTVVKHFENFLFGSSTHVIVVILEDEIRKRNI